MIASQLAWALRRHLHWYYILHVKITCKIKLVYGPCSLRAASSVVLLYLCIFTHVRLELHSPQLLASWELDGDQNHLSTTTNCSPLLDLVNELSIFVSFH